MATGRFPSITTDSVQIGSAIGKSFKLLGLIVFFFFSLWCVFNTFEWNDAGTILIVQYPKGSIGVFTDSGPCPQWFGTVTKWPKTHVYKYEQKIQFSDRGHGTLKGSVQLTLPRSQQNVVRLLQEFRTIDSIQENLLYKVVNKVIFSTGALMTSKESSAEKRNDIPRYIEDQLKHGMYQTKARENRRQPATKEGEATIPEHEEKTIIMVDIVHDAQGKAVRQEDAVLPAYGIEISNTAVEELPYDDDVEKQIKDQQRLTMAIQTRIAEAQQAEQEAITAEAKGRAEAATARWAQEKLKATAVTKAEQERDVAKLAKETAEYYKQAQILEGEGEAAKKRLLMNADGQLNPKLEAWKAVNGVYAEALKHIKVPVVPSVIMGNGDGKTPNSVQSLMDMISVKTAKDLGLSMDMKQGGSQ